MVGQVVIHKVFGKGTIIRVRGNYIDVAFTIGEKSFIYPDCFVTFLRMEDPAQQSAVEVEIQRIADEKRRAMEELERQRREAKERDRLLREAKERAREEERARRRDSNRNERDEPSFERLTDDRQKEKNI